MAWAKQGVRSYFFHLTGRRGVRRTSPWRAPAQARFSAACYNVINPAFPASTHLSKVELLKSPLRLPKLPEQTAIASVLTEVDGELVALPQRREKTRALK